MNATKLTRQPRIKPGGSNRKKSFSKVEENGSTVATLELAPAFFTIKRILVPVDFSANSHKALQYAHLFFRQFGAQVDLLHVVEPVCTPQDCGYGPVKVPTPSRTRLNKWLHRLQQIASRFGLGEGQVHCQVVVGSTHAEILQRAIDLPADLIILNTHGYTGVEHLLHGSITERVVREAPCPVLVVREQERDFLPRRKRKPARTTSTGRA